MATPLGPIFEHKCNSTHIVTEEPQPHKARRVAMLKKYPHLDDLMRPRIETSYFVLGIVSLQIATAYALSYYDVHWGVVLFASWSIGAVANQALWTLIHDLSHSAVFESSEWNLIYHIVANLPIVFPAAISFKYFHGLHHSHLNEAYGDPDLPSHLEQTIFGGSAIGKLLWLMFFVLIQPIRTFRYTPKFGDLTKWLVLNWVFVLAFDYAVFHFWGVKALAYLTIGSIFSIGLHPVGARWVAEHYSLRAPQETYSYYGSFNIPLFNIGYHNEHHDLPSVPWMDLPKLKAAAPEFYDNLAYHTSYWRLFFDFLLNPAFTLESRVVRLPKSPAYLKGGAKAGEDEGEEEEEEEVGSVVAEPTSTGSRSGRATRRHKA